MKSSLVLVSAALLAAAALAPSRAHAAPPARCAALAQRYRADVDMVSRYAAFNEKAGEHLPGSQRAAAETRETNAIGRAKMSLDAARGAGCRPAPLVSSPERYEADADTCAVELIGAEWGGQLPRSCDPARWRQR